MAIKNSATNSAVLPREKKEKNGETKNGMSVEWSERGVERKKDKKEEAKQYRAAGRDREASPGGLCCPRLVEALVRF